MLDFGSKTDEDSGRAFPQELFEKHGNGLRKFRNGLGIGGSGGEPGELVRKETQLSHRNRTRAHQWQETEPDEGTKQQAEGARTHPQEQCGIGFIEAL